MISTKDINGVLNLRREIDEVNFFPFEEYPSAEEIEIFQKQNDPYIFLQNYFAIPKFKNIPNKIFSNELRVYSLIGNSINLELSALTQRNLSIYCIIEKIICYFQICMHSKNSKKYKKCAILIRMSAAEECSTTKKTIDDYMRYLKWGIKLGFPFYEHMNESFGFIRKWVKGTLRKEIDNVNPLKKCGIGHSKMSEKELFEKLKNLVGKINFQRQNSRNGSFNPSNASIRV